ncbi:Glutathione synthetase [Spiromyces aspiralis]|uniref:Glutathione synthetase n=1 Tax=Spiromyces aspiralis TaxID=68401 RepID=A0ACC1HY24_9FUNG|nr:Glutathione synthetase [Spiromyces aspiralis]
MAETKLSLAPTYSATVDKAKIEELRSLAADWASMHGLQIKAKASLAATDAEPLESVPAPYALLPTPFPQSCFEEATRIQPLLNRLYHRVAMDQDFLREVIEPIVHADDFTRRLYDIYRATQGDPCAQKAALGLYRSDYLVDAPAGAAVLPQIKQVEFNTIATSLSSVSALVGRLHRYLLEYTDGYRGLVSEPSALLAIGHDGEARPRYELPDNEALTSMADGLAAAHNHYNWPGARILFVVQPGERNKFDQLWIQDQLWQRHQVRTLRYSLTRLDDAMEVDPATRRLTVDGHEISVIYFRAGYTPHDYPTEREWTTRLRLEQSYAIKCPTVAHHLAGSKKVQQVLAQPSVLKRFLDSPDELAQVHRCFVELYPLDGSPDGRKAYEMAMADPSGLVLKPQREGGGFNVYKQDIPGFLSKLSVEEQSSYILMDLIRPPTFGNWLCKDGQVAFANVVCELGVYGVFLNEGESILVNKTGGHLLRTKPSDVNEGGVVAGFGVLDSPLLI